MMPGPFSDIDLTPNPIELARRRAAQRGYIDLTSSNPTYQGLLFPAEVLSAAAERYWRTRRYDPDPRGLLPAREAIVRYYAQRSPALALRPDQVFMTASTSESYALLFNLLTDPGDNILAPEIGYPLFDYLAAIARIQLRPFPLDESRGWQIDEQQLLACADERTRAVLIVSPHNPTGVIVGQPTPALDRLGLPVICDEVFARYTYRAASVPPLGALHPDLPVFHLNGISKMFALPDLKLGWIALNEPAAVGYGDRLELLNDTFLSASTLTQTILPDLFEAGEPFVAAMQARIRGALDRALAILAACDQVRVPAPEGGPYLFAEVFGWSDEEALVIHLLDHGVLVHPGYFYGHEHGTHIMISCLVEPEQLDEGLHRLVRGLAARS